MSEEKSSFEKSYPSGSVYKTQKELSSSILSSSDQDSEHEKSHDLSTSVVQSSAIDPEPNKPHDLNASVLLSSDVDLGSSELHDLTASVILSSEIVHNSDQSDLDENDNELADSDLPGIVVTLTTNRCNVCENKATSKILEAAWYCPECDELLCHECKTFHGAFKMSKYHTLASLYRPCQPCKKRKNLEVAAAFYCADCQEFLCDDCMASHEAFKLLENHKVITSVEKIKERQQTEKRKSVSTDISTYTNQSPAKILSTKPFPKSERIMDSQDKIPTEQTHLKGILKKDTKTEKTAKKSDPQSPKSKDVNGLGRKSQTKQEAKKSFIQRFRDIWPAKKDTKPIMDIKPCVMERIIVEPATVIVAPFTKLTPRFVTKFDAKVPGDTETPLITDSAFLPNSGLLLLDDSNKKLKLFDDNYQYVTHEQFSIAPVAVSVYDNSEVAVVSGHDFIRLSVSGEVIREKNRIRTFCDYWGVSYVNSGEVAITSSPWDGGKGSFGVYDIASALPSSSSRVFRTLGWHKTNFTVDRNRSRAYLANEDNGTVSVIDLKTNMILFEYEFKDRKHPTIMTVDQYSNLYVYGSGSDAIRVSPEGEQIQILLSSDGLYTPWTMSFTHRGDDTFIVGNKNNVLVYKMPHK